MKDQVIPRFRLYVVADSPSGKRAIANFEQIRQALPGSRAELEVVDILQHPSLADEDRILAVPTLLRVTPPRLRIIGDLSNLSNLKTVLGG